VEPSGYTDNDGRVIDFHGLRHTCGAWAAMGGASPKAIQTLMRDRLMLLIAATVLHGVLLAAATAQTGRQSQAAAASRPDRIYYEVIPLHGTFGCEIRADVVADVLRRSRGKSEFVILDIDSPGGFTAEAKKIAEVMQKHEDDFTFVALVRDGISAAIWPAFESDVILLVEGGVLGGALSYTQAASGTPEYDAKQNSIWAATIESAATENGWNGDVARAMIVPESHLYYWRSGDGVSHLSADPPKSGHAEQVDSSEELLTISSNRAQEWGFPPVVPADLEVEQLGDRLVPGATWKRRSRYGAPQPRDEIEVRLLM